MIDDRLLCLGMIPPLPRRASKQVPPFKSGISLQEFLAVDASTVTQWSFGPEPAEDALPRQLLLTTEYDERDRVGLVASQPEPEASVLLLVVVITIL